MQCKALFFALFLPLMVNAQNLVPNWSFEEYEDCPDGMAQIDRATGWMSFRLTPDYFNTCDETQQVGVPSSVLAENIPALQGDAYAGFGRNHNNGYSEVVGIKLTDTLYIDSIYYVSFYVRRILYYTSFGVTDCWNDKIGARFSTVPYQDWPAEVAMPVDNEAHVYHNGMLESLDGWIKVDGYFQADSAFNYIGIGYHFNEDSMHIDCIDDPFPVFTYFFVDCICVSKDPEMCPNCDVVSSYESFDKEFMVLSYPNPFNDHFVIELSDNRTSIKEIELFSAEGRRLFKRSIQNENRIMINNLESYKDGLYIIVVEFENGTTKQLKLIKK